MADVLASDADFLHYIGHVDPEGIRCADGWLDTNSLETVNVTSFLLNACQSYEQGRGLVEAGSIGGIVTVTDVLNATAVKLGRTTANLIDTGFSLLSTLEILEKKSLAASQYMVIGDGTATVVKSQSGTPNLISVEPAEDGMYRTSVTAYPSDRHNLGTLFKPHISGETHQYLNSGHVSEYLLTEGELQKFLSLQRVPVELPGRLNWSETVRLDEI
jgi:hypothetical protein